MKIAYFDCFSGISGDMCLGAFIDAGVSLKQLKNELKKIPVSGYALTSKKVHRSKFSATKVDVVTDKKIENQKYNGRKWSDIEKIINNSSLHNSIKEKGLRIFRRIFKAESKVHGRSFDQIHIHELGAIDCIIDIFGTLICLDILGIEKIFSSPLNLGSGSTDTEHGIIPVPSPATLEILKKIPVYSREIPFELTTPTGAAIVKELSSGFGDIPAMKIETTGSGAGNRDFENWPNVLRIFIGVKASPAISRNDSIIVIETNIDDMNPQIYEYVIERLFEEGAVDVFLTQIIMKKGRPGVKLTVLCYENNLNKLTDILFKETTTIGIRYYKAERKILERQIKEIDTAFGMIRVKVSGSEKYIIKSMPEYDDCKRLAKKNKVPLINLINNPVFNKTGSSPKKLVRS